MNDISLTALECNLKYLKLLSRQYPTIASACTEIINLQSILNLPKGTEHFLTDIHGEYSAFTHVLKNASGVIKRKIEDIFGTTLRSNEKKRLATLIYYPELKLQHIKNSNEENNINDFYRITLYQLLELCRNVSSKYTRSKVRKALPVDFAYIIEELLQNYENTKDKHEYYNEIINTIISIDRADEFIIAISELIQQLVVDRLHILGDIYDRGPGPHIIIDELMLHHCVDIQWGNHDIVWLGAASGSIACIANVIRICIRYSNLKILEEGYGINMLPLATFAMETYKDDPCTCFLPKMSKDEIYRNKELQLISQMHKAITIIQFKIEGALIKRRPDFEMNNRLLLDKIDYENGTITIDNISYPLLDCGFPTIDPKDPYKLSGEEEELINKLKTYFVNSEKLQKHAGFLYSKGSLYLNVNSNLLYHGCIPLNEDGSFKSVSINNDIYKGKSLLDKCDAIAREAFFLGQDTTITSAEKQYALDGIWYLWCGENSPLFGKDKMATFERYFISESEIHTEVKNPYFTLRNDESICSMILNEFNLDPLVSHIINGHVPVKANQGENPIKANGKLLVIDGGFSKAYQPETGIAGYTLIYNSYGLVLVSHEPFESTEKAITEEQDILSSTRIVESNIERKRVADTDIGFELINQIEDIKMLLCAYRKGLIKENS